LAKIKKKIFYPPTLDLQPFLSSPEIPKNSPKNSTVTKNGKENCKYNLAGVLVHEGNTINSGHYYSIVKAPNNIWYFMNDASVRKSSQHEALSQEAYILFYCKNFLQDNISEDQTDVQNNQPIENKGEQKKDRLLKTLWLLRKS